MHLRLLSLILERYRATTTRILISMISITLPLGVSADECLPSEWGADDQIGAANRVDP